MTKAQPILQRVVKKKAMYVLVSVIIILSYLILFYMQEDIFEYNYNLIEQGEYWRLMTGNFVHLNYMHWKLNIIGLLVILVFFGRYGTFLDWLAVVGFTGFFLGGSLYFFDPNIVSYVGLSGILHGLMAYGILHEIHYHPISGYVLLALLTGKLTWEYLYGSMFNTESLIGSHVVTEAHMYSAIGGMIIYFIISLDKEVQIRKNISL